MRKIALTQGKTALLDDEDYERINKLKWCAIKDKHTYYAGREEQGRLVYMHHKVIGKPPLDFVTDHIDGNGLHNWHSNLRHVTSRENMQYKNKKDEASIYPGVCWDKDHQKWRARITIDGLRKQLGYFDNELEAYEAYQNALIDLEAEESTLPVYDSVEEIQNCMQNYKNSLVAA